MPKMKNSIIILLGKSKNSIEAKNFSWLVSGRIVQMIISLIVGLLTARYLGPSNYGLINYAAAYISFFASICTLGINSIIVNANGGTIQTGDQHKGNVEKGRDLWIVVTSPEVSEVYYEKPVL